MSVAVRPATPADVATILGFVHDLAAFEREPSDFIAVNSAGCGAMMKEYGDLLADDPGWFERARAVSVRVRDVSELLAAAGPKPANANGRPRRRGARCRQR